MITMGTEPQVKRAENIKVTAMLAARDVYNADSDNEKYGISFKESRVGHLISFACNHIYKAGAWMDTFGKLIDNYYKKPENKRDVKELSLILDRLELTIYQAGEDINMTTGKLKSVSMWDLYSKEERELEVKRKEAKERYEKEACKEN